MKNLKRLILNVVVASACITFAHTTRAEERCFDVAAADGCHAYDCCEEMGYQSFIGWIVVSCDYSRSGVWCEEGKGGDGGCKAQ